MNKSKKNEAEEPLLESVSKTQLFFNQNKKLLLNIAIAIVVVAAAAVAYYFFVYAPKKQEALDSKTRPETAFLNQQYKEALEGNGETIGFADLIDEYGKKAGKAVYAYAGFGALNLKEYDTAIEYLNKYDGKEPLLESRVAAAKGDAYCGLGDYEKAIGCYEKAVKLSDSAFNGDYLLSAGHAAEKLQKYEQALTYYQRVKAEYPQSIAGSEIDRYIGRVETLLAK